MSFSGARVLITGGLGFIGSSLARRLVEQGARVSVVDALIPEAGGNRFNIDGFEGRMDVAVGDVRDARVIGPLVEGRDYLFNLAGRTSHMDSMDDPHADLESNCAAPLAVLEACRRRNPGVKIVFASTRQIYGKPESLPVGEDHPLRPIDVNGVNKLAGESYHAVYGRIYGIRTCSLRLTNTIGPGMRIKDARQTFLGLWIRALLEGAPIPVWGGRQLRDLTCVDDAVEAFLLAARSPKADGRVYNVGGAGPITLADLAELLIKAHGGGRRVIESFPEDRKRIDIGDYYADGARIAAELGWRPKTSLASALERVVRFYREHARHYL